MSLLNSIVYKFPFGNPAERGFWLYKTVPPSFLRKIEEENFRHTVKFVYEHSKFYKKQFDERKIDPSKIKTPADLGDFYTTPEDIRKSPDDFVCLKADTAYESTGTTSKKTKRVYFSRTEVKEAGWAGAVGLWGLGIRPEDRMASAFDYSFWVSGPVLQASCEVQGWFHVEAGRLDPADFYERLSDYKLSVIVGDPSWLLALTEIAEKKGAWPLKLMIGGGENMTEETRLYIEGVWKHRFILSYGQTEAFGAIGMESLGREGYHLNEFHNFFEIINRDAEGYGELVYTTLNRRVMPLLRYRSGDITRFLTGSSKIGFPGRRIEKLKGRVDEWTPTGMGNIAPWMFESVFTALPGITADWQIVIDKENNRDRLVFHLEGKKEAAGDRLKEEIFSRIKKEFADAWKMHEMGLFYFGLELHSEGALRGNERKLKRIVDRRKF